MTETDWLAERFEAHRSRLRAVAYRMLGSTSEADDAIQEAWLRVSRADCNGVENFAGWLTTIVSRVSLDMLRSRSSRREEPLDPAAEGTIDPHLDEGDPERDALMADSLGPALMIVLESLAPAERLTFVLHDPFGAPYDEIAPILGHSSAAARQLASRARRRVRGAELADDASHDCQREVVQAFLAASRNGDFAALLSLLDPDAVLRADSAAVAMGVSAEVVGTGGVAKTFAGRAGAAKIAWIDGVAGAVWAPGGIPRVVFTFRIEGDRITGIDLTADQDRIRSLELRINVNR
jgi:RNA polymerase sigma factor (sigma-70 family)